MNLPANQVAAFATAQGVQPDEPLTISVPVIFTPTDQVVQLDLSGDPRFVNFDLQGIFLDASGFPNASHLTCNIAGSNQTISIPNGTQAYQPILAPQRSLDKGEGGTPGKLALTFTMSVAPGANVTAVFQLLNTPVSPLVWTA